MGELDDQVYEFLLNGMPVHEFVGWLVLAIGGAVVYLIIRIIIALGVQKEKYDKNKMKVGLLKLLASIVIIPWVILWFEDVAPVILEFMFDTGTDHVEIALNGLSAPFIGFSVDRFIHVLYKKASKKK
jgi:uncharacterized membrane protein